MFHRSLLHRGLIKSDEGFSVETLSMTSIEYREGNHVLRVGCEPLAIGVQLFRSTVVCWGAPFESEMLPAAKKEEILTRVCHAFKFIGEPCRIV